MKTEVHIEWLGQTRCVGFLHAADRSLAVSFEYAKEWIDSPDAFAIDPVALPLQTGVFHAGRLFGAMLDCGPDRWGEF